jgi:DNA-directed RNA polymerase subunit alpha
MNEPSPSSTEPAAKVDELELSVRSANCLKNDNIVYIGDLCRRPRQRCCARRTSAASRSTRSRKCWPQMGLHLGMEIPNWPPENIEELAKKLEQEHSLWTEIG